MSKKKKTYNVALPYYATVFVQVEASSREEAIEKAIEEASPSICCHCAREIELDEYNSDVEPSAYTVDS